MPLPLLGFAAGLAGGLLGSGLTAYPSGIISSYFDPKILKKRYQFNSDNRTQLPDIQQFIGLYLENLVSLQDLSKVLAFHNIPLTIGLEDEWSNNVAKWWQLIINNSVPKLDIPHLYYLYHSGIMPDDKWREVMKRYSFNANQVEYLKHLYYAKFDQGTIFTGHFRGYTKEATTVRKIRRLYGCDKGDAEDILSTAGFLPPVSDLLRFAVRDVYNPDVVDRLQLDAEYNEIEEIKPWARAIGIPERTTLGPELGNKDRDILRDYWRAHWQLISPTQGYEALHRLRPDRIQRYLGQIPGLKPFQFAELNDLLKMSDYLPEQRRILAATSYHVIGRIDLRRLYESDIIELGEAYEQLQDQGYNPTDAGYLRDWMKGEKKKKKDKEEQNRNKKVYGRLVNQMEKGYMEGSVNRDTVLSALMNFGYEPDEASAIVNAIDIEINRKRVVTFIRMVRSEFVLGLYTGVEAVGELIQGGVTNIRASQYVIQWQRMLDRPRRIVSANTVIDWLKRGIISFANAKSRLDNLGFSNSDTLLYLESAQQDIQKAITIEELKRARTEQQQAREAERLQRQMQYDIRSMQSQLRSYSPIAKMIKWVQIGLMDVGTFEQRLTFLGVAPEDIARYLLEVTGGTNGTE